MRQRHQNTEQNAECGDWWRAAPFRANLLAVDFPAINGYGHLNFTVTDVEGTARWWETVMGFTIVHAEQRESGVKVWNVYHPGLGAVGFVEHPQPGTDRFDERSVGLDHFALRVPDRAALDDWAKHLDDLGVENSGIQEEIGGPLIVFRDPDNIQLEVWAVDWDLVNSNVDSEQA